MATLESLEAELAEHDANLREMQEALEVLPGDSSVLETIKDIEELKASTINKIAILKASPARLPSPKPLANDTAEEPRLFRVNELVHAKYAGDRQYYPATIISVMGSKHDPIYTVNFKGYSGTETVHANHVKPAPVPTSVAGQKRRADVDATAANAPPPPPPPSNGDATAPTPPAASGNADNAASKPKRKRGVDRSLDKAKASWQSWQAKTSTGKIAKVANKESQFRTGDKPAATAGSGQPLGGNAPLNRHWAGKPDGRR